jgi:putative FmdB family regulatory protein
MPIFEYKCPSCGKMQEILVKSGSGKAPDCPDCGKKMDKQFSSFAAVVKEPAKSPPQCQGCPKGCRHMG